MFLSRKVAGIGLAAALVAGFGATSLAPAEAASGVATVREWKTVDLPSEIAIALGMSRAEFVNKVYVEGKSIAEIGAEKGYSRADTISRLDNRAATFLLPKDRATAAKVIRANVDRHVK